MSKEGHLYLRTYKHFFPEQYLIEILCKATSTNTSINKKEIIQLTQRKSFSWQKLISLIRANHLSKIILDFINIHNLGSYFPSSFIKQINLDQLKIEYFYNYHIKQSSLILRNLLKNRIEFVVMKTYPFNDILFNKQPYKIYCDLDILIPIHHFKKTANILLKNGYKYFPSHRNRKGSNYIPFIDFYCPKTQEVFKKNGHQVELHTTIVDNFFFDIKILNEKTNQYITNTFFFNSKTKAFRNLKIKAFTPSDLVISLFLHSFFQHNLQSGVTYYEFFLIFKKLRKVIQWDYIIKFIKRIKMEPYFLWFLYLFNDLYPNTLPSKINRSVKNYKQSLKVQHKLLFLYMKYKIFHPTKFLLNPAKEKEKELCWSIIDNQLLKLIGSKIRNKISRLIEKF